MPKLFLTFAAAVVFGCLTNLSHAATQQAQNQPLFSQLLAPHIYGAEDAPLKVILIHSPITPESNEFILNGLSPLSAMVQQGKILLQIKTYYTDTYNVPVALIASCLDSTAYLPFLLNVAQNIENYKRYPAGFMQALVDTVVSNTTLRPQGLDEIQTRQRLAECGQLQSNFILTQEKERLEDNYMYKVGFPEYAPALIINGRYVTKGFKSFHEIAKYLP